MRAISYTHQSNGLCAGMWAYDRTYEMEKTGGSIILGEFSCITKNLKPENCPCRPLGLVLLGLTEKSTNYMRDLYVYAITITLQAMMNF